MPYKSGLTLDEHETIAADLRAVRDCMIQLRVQLCGVYTADITDQARQIQSEIDELRNRLDEQFFRENPELRHSPYFVSSTYAQRERTPS